MPFRSLSFCTPLSLNNIINGPFFFFFGWYFTLPFFALPPRIRPYILAFSSRSTNLRRVRNLWSDVIRYSLKESLLVGEEKKLVAAEPWLREKFRSWNFFLDSLFSYRRFWKIVVIIDGIRENILQYQWVKGTKWLITKDCAILKKISEDLWQSLRRANVRSSKVLNKNRSSKSAFKLLD